MKKLLILTVLVLVIAFAGVAIAGDFHSGSSLICSQCHIMHASQSHSYVANQAFTPAVLTPHVRLLKETANDLCLSCHDGSPSITDVFEIPSDGVVRAAGGLNNAGTVAGLYHQDNGHSLGSIDQAPGGTFENTAGLNCTDCHNAHGYADGVGNPWRNLVAVDVSSNLFYMTYNTGAVDPTFDVTQAVVRDYVWSNLTFNKTTASPLTSAYADYCKACHTDFHGAVGSAEIGGTVAAGDFIRHPAAEVLIGAIGGGHSNAGVYGSHANQVLVQIDGTDLTPSCFSCHKGHGNQNPFGLIVMEGGGAAVDEEGDGGAGVQDLCGQCHVQ